jgi:very-short-patch-repair endonuclease
MPKPRRSKGKTYERAKELREEITPAEQKLWAALRVRQLGGYKFRRQHPLGPFIVDFYCNKAKLVIELDGDTHAEQETYDNERTEWLESHGLRVIRFTNNDVHTNLDGVAQEILRVCEERQGA